MGQSRISTHLALLKEVGLVIDRRAGRRSYYSIHAGPAASLWERVLAESEKSPEFEADREGLEALRRRRVDTTRSYFDRVAASFGQQPLPGRTWEGLARGVLQLAPRVRYADLGIGDGMLTLMLSEVARPRHGRRHLRRRCSASSRRARRRRGSATSRPSRARSRTSRCPTHRTTSPSSQPGPAPRRGPGARRSSRGTPDPGSRSGRVLVIELLAHSEDWVREKLQHRHLGFTEIAARGTPERGGLQVGLQACHPRRARSHSPPTS